MRKKQITALAVCAAAAVSSFCMITASAEETPDFAGKTMTISQASDKTKYIMHGNGNQEYLAKGDTSFDTSDTSGKYAWVIEPADIVGGTQYYYIKNIDNNKYMVWDGKKEDGTQAGSQTVWLSENKDVKGNDAGQWSIVMDSENSAYKITNKDGTSDRFILSEHNGEILLWYDDNANNASRRWNISEVQAYEFDKNISELDEDGYGNITFCITNGEGKTAEQKVNKTEFTGGGTLKVALVITDIPVGETIKSVTLK